MQHPPDEAHAKITAALRRDDGLRGNGEHGERRYGEVTERRESRLDLRHRQAIETAAAAHGAGASADPQPERVLWARPNVGKGLLRRPVRDLRMQRSPLVPHLRRLFQPDRRYWRGCRRLAA